MAKEKNTRIDLADKFNRSAADLCALLGVLEAATSSPGFNREQAQRTVELASRLAEATHEAGAECIELLTGSDTGDAAPKKRGRRPRNAEASATVNGSQGSATPEVVL